LKAFLGLNAAAEVFSDGDALTKFVRGANRSVGQAASALTRGTIWV